jgi:hypothetical protein
VDDDDVENEKPEVDVDGGGGGLDEENEELFNKGLVHSGALRSVDSIPISPSSTTSTVSLTIATRVHLR